MARFCCSNCPFDPVLDDYGDDYSVYVLEKRPPDDGSWEDLPVTALAQRGRVPVSTVAFDPTKRKYVSEESIGQVLDSSPN